MVVNKLILAASIALVATSCQPAVSSAPTAAIPADNSITMADGRTVVFHNFDASKGTGIFLSAAEKQAMSGGLFSTKAYTARTVSAITGTANTSGFIVNITGTGLASGDKVFLARQGGTVGALLAAHLTTFSIGQAAPSGGAYNTIVAGSGLNASITMPGTLPAGTYGIGISSTVPTLVELDAQLLLPTGVKTAFTITDNTAWAAVSTNAMTPVGLTTSL